MPIYSEIGRTYSSYYINHYTLLGDLLIKRIRNKEINFYYSAHAILMILLASVESIPYSILSSYTSTATMWLEQVITYVIHSHHFNT